MNTVDIQTMINSQFEILFCRYYPQVVPYATEIFNDKTAREDMAQEVFLYVWEKRKSLHLDDSFYGYLLRSAYSNCIDCILDHGFSILAKYFTVPLSTMEMKELEGWSMMTPENQQLFLEVCKLLLINEYKRQDSVAETVFALSSFKKRGKNIFQISPQEKVGCSVGYFWFPCPHPIPN